RFPVPPPPTSPLFPYTTLFRSARVKLFRVDNLIQIPINQARLKLRGGIQEVMPPKLRLIGSLFIAVPQRKIQFSGDFTSPFFPAFLLGFLNGLFDGGQGLLIRFRNEDTNRIFRLLALGSRPRLEHVHVAEAYFSSYHFRHLNLLLFEVQNRRVNFRPLVAFGNKCRFTRRFFDQPGRKLSKSLPADSLFKLSNRF